MENYVIQIAREGLYLAVLVSAPPVLTSLLIGLIVSVIQATTPDPGADAHLRAEARRRLREFGDHRALDHRAARALYPGRLRGDLDVSGMSALSELLSDPGQRALAERAIVLWALVAARIAPIVYLVPYFGGKATPQPVKAGVSIALTALVYPIVWGAEAAPVPAGAFALAALTLKELALGLTFGFVAALMFDAVRVAGQVIDAARGQTMATAMVPQLPERASVSGAYLYQLTIVVFLFAGGHRVLIAALARSYRSVPPTEFPALGEDLGELAVGIARLGADSIAVGVGIALPVLAASLLIDVTLGLVNRAAPQIQVFFLGMPIKAVAGAAVLALAVDAVAVRVIDEAGAAARFLYALLGAS